jgi:hypothetical protein
MMKNRRTAHNNVLPQLAVTCNIQGECYYQTFVQIDSEVLRNARQLLASAVVGNCKKRKKKTL